MEIDEIAKLDSFILETYKVLKPFENLKISSKSIKYLINNSYRTYDILISINCICSNIKNLSEIEHPLGILLRSGLYDFINFQFYSNKCITNEILDSTKFENEIEEYLKGHFNSMAKNDVIMETYKSILEFKSDGKLKEYKTLGVLKEGRDFANQKKLNYLHSAIDSWEWYSKYEHYGFFTYDMLNDVEGNKNRIYESIKILYYNVYLTMLAIHSIDSTLINLLKIEPIEDIILNKTKN